MNASKKLLAAAIAFAAASVGTLVVRNHAHTSSEPSSAVAAAPCAVDTGACGAHAMPKDQVAAPRVEGRPRMLAFSSHDCPACNRMKPVLDAVVKACDGEHVVEHVDFDQEAGEALATTYEVHLLPSFVSVDASGREVARLTGVQPPEVLEHALEEVQGIRCASIDLVRDRRPM